jgi:hypothetical protein
MSIWEADFYRRPLQDENGNPLWELLICDPDSSFRYSAFCSQSEARADWLLKQLQPLATEGHSIPKEIRVFRPQTLNLLESAANSLGIKVEPTRQTPTLKAWLEERSQQYPKQPNYTGQPYEPLNLDKPPPLPLPENLWGEQWRFASLTAGDIAEAFTDRMIPVLEMPEGLLPLHLGLASTTLVPGVVIIAGRRSMQLARWLQNSRPASLSFISGAPDGLILEAGLIDRWIIATFDDVEVASAAQTYEQRKQSSKGLHFLLVQPDDSGMTYSGFWLLQ